MPINSDGDLLKKIAGGTSPDEDKLALWFVTKRSADLQYTSMWSKWLTWDSARWEPENTLGIFDMIRKDCRENPTGKEK